MSREPIIVILTTEACRKSKRPRLVASHGVGLYSLRSYPLPPDISPQSLGARWHKGLGEWLV